MLICMMESNTRDRSTKWKQVLKNLLGTLKNRHTKLSHRHVRALIKKEKRKQKRQILAQERETKEEDFGDFDSNRSHQIQTEEGYSIHEEYQERERRRLHYLWLKREEQAQIDFLDRKERKEREQIEKQILIQKNLEELEKLEEKERNEKTVGASATDKEERCQDVISKLPEGSSEPWHNPIAPLNFIMKEREQCMFFTKTGACRFGERCSRSHERPSISCTILIHGMFRNFGLDQALRDEYDTDLMLEYEDSETYQHFKDFYEDVLPEFKKLGKVVQFKVCCNQEPHLRGNVYVQYTSEESAHAAYAAFNGRWYASRQLTCEFCPVTQWKLAICGLFHSKRCPKGRTCNFLHVFRNPTNEFWLLDRGNASQGNSSHRQTQKSQSRTPESSRKRRQRSNSPESSRSGSSRSKYQRTSYRNSRRSRSRSPDSSRRRRSRSSSTESTLRRRSPRHSRRKRSPSPSYSRRRRSPRSSKGKTKERTNRYATKFVPATNDDAETVCAPPNATSISDSDPLTVSPVKEFNSTRELETRDEPDKNERVLMEQQEPPDLTRNGKSCSQKKKHKKKKSKKKRRSSVGSPDSSSESWHSLSPIPDDHVMDATSSNTANSPPVGLE